MKTLLYSFRKSAEKLASDESTPPKGHFPWMYLTDESTGNGGAVDGDLKIGPSMAEWLPLNILVVDDAEVNQLLVTKMLEKLGYTPTVVTNGQEAFDAVMRANYELILMDLFMPELNGIEATKMIRESLEDESPLIIGITSSIFDEELNEGKEAGIDDFVQKPFRTEDLINKLNFWEKELRIKTKN